MTMRRVGAALIAALVTLAAVPASHAQGYYHHHHHHYYHHRHHPY